MPMQASASSRILQRTGSSNTTSSSSAWNSSSTSSLSDLGAINGSTTSINGQGGSTTSLLTSEDAGSGEEFDFSAVDSLRAGGSISFDGLLSSLAEAAGASQSPNSSMQSASTPTAATVRRFPGSGASSQQPSRSASSLAVPTVSSQSPDETLITRPATSAPIRTDSHAAARLATSDQIITYVASLRKGASGVPASVLPRSPHMHRSIADAAALRAGSPRGPLHNRNQSTESTGSMASADDEADERLEMLARPSSRQRSAPRELTGFETVDLGHRNIGALPAEVVRLVAGQVERFALCYNYLNALPVEFAQLGTSLRYLNIRVNSLTVFPDVVRVSFRFFLRTQLCNMPSLEILDISRNKIRKLPSQPGTLKSLKVLSVSRNRIKRLPIYFGHRALLDTDHLTHTVTSLKVLKCDHNPIEWPPRDVIAFPDGSESDSLKPSLPSRPEESETMTRWLRGVQAWINGNAAAYIAARRHGRGMPQPLTNGDQETGSEDDRHLTAPLTLQTKRSRIDLRPGTPIQRTPSPSANMSLPSETPRPTRAKPSLTVPTDQSTTAHPLPSPRSGDLTPRMSHHSRNASATTINPAPPRRPDLRSKKSLPDLRQNHAMIIDERMGGSTSPSLPRSAALTTVARRPRADSIDPGLAPSPSATSPPVPMLRGVSSDGRAVPVQMRRRPSGDGTAIDREPSPQAIGGDRNSGAYFRRLSMLPASTISKSVPLALLHFVDAIRGILFALSQIYAALRQFTVFASPDRLPGSLSRMLNTADSSMSRLINALDRFDSSTRRSTPVLTVVVELFETCRDNVVVFSKLVSVLSIQLKSLTAAADVRYTRTLLLMLYGSMAEIGNAWSAMMSLSQDVAGLVRNASSSTAMFIQPATPSPKDAPPLPEIPASLAGQTLPPPGSFKPPPIGPPPVPGSNGRQMKMRRHAGSFSVADVQAGAALPTNSPTDSPTSSNPSSVTTPTSTSSMKPRLNAPKVVALPIQSTAAGLMPAVRDIFSHLNDLPPTPISLMPSSGQLGASPSPSSTHSRNTSDVSSNAAPTSTSASSVGDRDRDRDRTGIGAMMLDTSLGPVQRPVTPGSGAIDDDFLDLVDSTTNVAFSTWGMLIEDLIEVTRSKSIRRAGELMDRTEMGNEVARRLKNTLASVRDERGPSDSRRLWNESQQFAKTVIHIASIAKDVSLEHSFPPPVREGLSQLAKQTNSLITLAAVIKPYQDRSL